MTADHSIKNTGLKLVVSIALTELAIMVLFRALHVDRWMPPLLIDLGDTLLLSVAASALIFYWVVAPMKNCEKQREMRQAMELFRSLVDQSNDALYIVDPLAGHFLDINVKAHDNLGCTREELLGMRIMDIETTIPDMDAWREFVNRVREKGTVVLEGLHKRRDGAAFPVEINAKYSLFAQKEYVVAVTRDITDRKRAEEALEEQKRFAENLTEHSAIATFVLDARHRVMMWSKSCEELTGVPAADMIGTDNHWKPFYDHQRQTLADVVIDGDVDKLHGLYPAFAPSTLAPNALHAEGWYRNLNGRDRYILFDAAPLYDGKGNLSAAIETLQDISERKRAEEALSESEHKLRVITNTATDSIVMIDEKGAVSYWNPAAERTLGYRADEVMGKDITLLIPHRYREAHKKAFNRFVETGRLLKLRNTYETTALKKDGAEIPVEVSVSGVLLQGRCYSVGVLREITERKKLEDQLRQAQKMEAIGQLAGGIAHDFNNILSAIIGYGHLIHMKMREDDPLRVNVEHMLESADRAAYLTHSLLAFSRKQIINPRPLNLNETVHRVEKLLRRLMGEDIELKISLYKENLTIFADIGQIEQVLMNLATNARDAMPRGGSFSIGTDLVELDDMFVRAHGYGARGRYAVITAADTGMGMDETTRKRIFDPFFTTKEEGRGTGLGLSIAYGIIKQHSGYINVYSEPGKGTSFRIYLPTVHEEIEGKKEAELPTSQLTGTGTVLLAEDDEALRILSRTVLEEFGYTVIEAVNGEDAIAKFIQQKDSIQLVILDMIMPRKSGKETYDEIVKVRPDIKALFVSGYTADKISLQNITEQGVELLLKPISPRDFLTKVRDIMSKKA